MKEKNTIANSLKKKTQNFVTLSDHSNKIRTELEVLKKSTQKGEMIDGDLKELKRLNQPKTKMTTGH